jgi:hypothetical protein
MTTWEMIELAKKLKDSLLPAVALYGQGADGSVLKDSLGEIAAFCDTHKERDLATGFRRIQAAAARPSERT